MFGKEFLNTAPLTNKRLTRSQSQLLRRLKGYIKAHYPEMPLEIYKFTFNQAESISFLNRRSDVPFIIRTSAGEPSGYIIASRNHAGDIEHHFIDLSDDEPQISLQVMGVFAGKITLDAHIRILMAQSDASKNDDAVESYSL